MPRGERLMNTSKQDANQSTWFRLAVKETSMARVHDQIKALAILDHVKNKPRGGEKTIGARRRA
jgi:hypothetical protein